MSIIELTIPKQYRATHFLHQIDEAWYLVPNDMKTTGQSVVMICGAFNTKGQFSGFHYLLKKMDLWF